MIRLLILCVLICITIIGFVFGQENTALGPCDLQGIEIESQKIIKSR